jgi:hypothetical protein
VHGSAIFPTRCASAISLRPPALPSIIAASFDGAHFPPSNPALPALLSILAASFDAVDPPPSNPARGSPTRGSSSGWFHAFLESSSRGFLRRPAPQWLPLILPVDPPPSNQAVAASFHPRIEQPRLPSMALLPSTASPAAAPLESRPCATSHPGRPPTMEGVMPVLVIRRGAVRT